MQKRIVIALAGVSLLTACGSTKLLSDKTPPDETQVIDGPGLVLPPDFDLRPPREAKDYESVLRQQKNAEAQGLITGVSGSIAGVSGSATVPADDQWLMKQAGGTAQPGIRDKIDSDVSPDKAAAIQKQKDSEGILKRWFGSHDDDDNKDE